MAASFTVGFVSTRTNVSAYRLADAYASQKRVLGSLVPLTEVSNRCAALPLRSLPSHLNLNQPPPSISRFLLPIHAVHSQRVSGIVCATNEAQHVSTTKIMRKARNSDSRYGVQSLRNIG